MEIEILSQSRDDIAIAALLYERQEPGLGALFANDIFGEIELLKYKAGIQVQKFGFFRYISKTYPFGIFYRIVDEKIQIAAVIDLRERPESIQEMLERR